ncbi:hypothetical protein [Erwinia sp. CGal63]|uniref:hypothetical protein n=1 Tax=Erwinia sp. CGal63 TaxID=2919889 RepID=UPI00300A62E8
MKYLLMILLVFSSFSGAAQVIDNNCKSPLSSTGMEMIDQMRDAMHIDPKSIVEKETTTELLFNEPVTDILSTYYAKVSYDEDGSLPLNEYKEIYADDNPRNLIIKFTFKNKQEKENVFLVSAIASDYECNIRYNGYIIAKREF